MRSRDSNRGVEDFYSLKQIQTVIRPRFYPLLCQVLTKMIKVIDLVCACVKTSAEDDDFQRLSKGEEGGGGYFDLRGFMFWSVIYHYSESIWVC